MEEKEFILLSLEFDESFLTLSIDLNLNYLVLSPLVILDLVSLDCEGSSRYAEVSSWMNFDHFIPRF